MERLESLLNKPSPPASLAEAREAWPVRYRYHPSPQDWRDQLFYFLLPDRFSDGREKSDTLLKYDLSTPEGVAAIRGIRGNGWNWERWQESGSGRFQGGTLKGVLSKLDYLQGLGVTTLWIAPIFRQRVELNTYHGYGVQDFLAIDPRFGSTAELVELVDAAHARGMYIILDIIFNHSGCNWLYDDSTGNPFQPGYLSTGSYAPVWPRNGYGSAIYDPNQELGRDDSVWPRELQGDCRYLRAGSGNLGAGDINDDQAEHKRTDFCDLRKFNLFSDETLSNLALAYRYWIALADIDGFRIDTFKHVTMEQARNFCNALKEYAESLGKEGFFLVAEVAGGNSAEDRYLDVSGRNLNACLDIGEQREIICNVGKGLAAGTDFFSGFSYYDPGMGSHRNWGSRHLSICNDHDHVFGAKLRIAADAVNDHQGLAAAALQLFGLGIPCLYYGTEQGLASGAESDQRAYLKGWGSSDSLLREAMFGPDHPRASGYVGTQGGKDAALPGFGPHGTSGRHVFNPEHPLYMRISLLASIRRVFKPLRRGRQYQRQISNFGNPFSYGGTGEIVAWSRIFDDQEVLVVVNPHGKERRGGRVIVDSSFSSSGMRIVANTDPFAPAEVGKGATVSVYSEGGRCFVALDRWLLGPSEVLVLANGAALERAKRYWGWEP